MSLLCTEEFWLHTEGVSEPACRSAYRTPGPEGTVRGVTLLPRLWFGAEVLVSGRLLAVRPILPTALPYKAAMAPPGLKQALLFCSICITIRAFPVVFVMLSSVTCMS